MNISILYYLFAVSISLLIAFFLYFFPKKKNKKVSWLLLILRFFTVLALLMLFINPKWEREELSVEKRQLVIAVDNTSSITFVKGVEKVRSIVTQLKKNVALQDKFDVKLYSFGEQTNLLDSLTFTENQSNPTDLINQVAELYSNSETPIILITDGNQTMGNSFEYIQGNNPVYPIVVGDTTQHVDLAITKINVNQYSFLDNQFPVEIFTLYKGTQNTGAQLSIYKNKNKIFTKKLQFSTNKNTQNVALMLPADAVGNHYYKAVISTLDKEINLQNNRKDFSVEVVDQQTEILILSSFSHPDLGALKESIESNKQRKATIVIGAGNTINLSKYQLVVLYQPTANQTSVINKINAKRINKFIITGTKTDWNFLNSMQSSFSKNTTKQTESYLGVFNSDFSEFVTKDIGFEQLPPLKDTFGTISFNVPFQPLLFQKIGNTTTQSPLLATFMEGNQKSVVLFGEDFWRWRMLSKIAAKNYKSFDDFWGAIIQYTANNEKINQLHLNYNKLFFSNQQVSIKASFVDENYQVNTKASLWLYLTNKETKLTEKTPFYLENDVFNVKLSDLKSGRYTFVVKAIDKDVNVYGSFKVLDYNVEQQFKTANINGLKKLAKQTGGQMIYTNTLETTLESILKNENYKSIQKSKIITKPLIDWHWLLGFIILSLSIEWFIRKYRGLI